MIKKIKQFSEEVRKLNVTDLRDQKVLTELAKLGILVNDILSMIAPHKRPYILQVGDKVKLKSKKE